MGNEKRALGRCGCGLMIHATAGFQRPLVCEDSWFESKRLIRSGDVEKYSLIEPTQNSDPENELPLFVCENQIQTTQSLRKSLGVVAVVHTV